MPILLALLFSVASAAEPICFVPLGDHDAGLLAVAVAGVEGVWGMPTRVLPASRLPAEAWYPPRSRWRADVLLDWLGREILPGSGCAMVVGFTRADISTTKPPYTDWGIFGLGALGGPEAVVSSHRLAPSARDRAHLEERVVKVANHEIGHMLGLPHCTTHGCLLEDANGTVATVDRETGQPCAACRAWLAR
jgi:archaemetzincin